VAGRRRHIIEERGGKEGGREALQFVDLRLSCLVLPFLAVLPCPLFAGKPPSFVCDCILYYPLLAVSDTLYIHFS
jgi:hypothetical protein